MEGKLMSLYCKPILLADSPVKITIWTDVHKIYDQATAIANKMTVWLQDTIKPFLSIHDAQTFYLAVLLKENQISVYCSQAKIGMSRFE